MCVTFIEPLRTKQTFFAFSIQWRHHYVICCSTLYVRNITATGSSSCIAAVFGIQDLCDMVMLTVRVAPVNVQSIYTGRSVQPDVCGTAGT